MRFLLTLTMACIGDRAVSDTPAEPLTTVSAINKALSAADNEGRPFEVTAKVIFTSRKWCGTVHVSDQTGTTIIETPDRDLRLQFDVGSVLALKGRLHRRPNGSEAAVPLTPKYHDFSILSTNTVPPKPITARQLYTAESLDEPFVLTGIIRDAFTDEVDPNFAFLALDCDGTTVYSAYYAEDDPNRTIERLMGESVSLVGIRLVEFPLRSNVRTHFSSIKPTGPVPADLFDVANLPDHITLPLSKELKRGRRKSVGFVLARWGNSCLLQSDTGQRLIAELSSPDLPVCGTHIVVSGLADTSLYLAKLRHALWRVAPTDLTLKSETPLRTNIRDIILDDQGRPKFRARLNGRQVTLRGRLIRPENVGKPMFFYLEQDGEIARIDFSTTPEILSGIPNGSLVDVTGACIMEMTEGPSLPHITGFFIATRTAEDFRLVSRPPWWTFGRLAILFGVVLFALGGVLVWSLMLKRLSERRGAELADEKLAVVESELKVYERTRLAIELHDLLSQMLSGISMQLGTVRKFLDTNREKTMHHLDIASKTLLACRESLRDCLWDLRNHALEEPDMAKAVRETLEPHIEDANVVIRFTMQRDRLTDNTAHTILSIIRELAVNAFRHGKATVVKIAGCIEDGKVLFSVADNGCGFDPETAPGMAQGHFGLQGIRERIEGFEGEMSVNSKSGHGTKVSISLNLPQENTGSVANE